MRRSAPDFWWRPEPTAAALALWPAARIWGAAAAWRMNKAGGYRPPVAVVCIGNFVVGGAGKTPTAIALARMARGRGLRPGLLASGYGGAATAPILIDPAAHTADQVGDEALLLAAVAPTVVSRDRAAGAKRLVEENVDIIIMDDGFQNPSLVHDLAIVAVDAAMGIGNGRVIPAGPLRAPLKPQIRRADALLVIGEGEAADPLVRAAARAGTATLRARIRPTRVKEWRKDPILAFAGIGHPEKFFATLKEAHAPVARTLSFPDHYSYGEVDAVKLLEIADAEKLRLVTTEKDMVRLGGKTGALAKLRERIEPFHVILEFDNPVAVSEMLDEAVRKASLAQPRDA
ncbi:MAG: tetraacyldisaccharide 4'-kinase [Bauldia sp.]